MPALPRTYGLARKLPRRRRPRKIRFPAAKKRRMEMKTLVAFVKCESGATAIEYGLIASLIGVAIITAVSQTGTQLASTFDKIKSQL